MASPNVPPLQTYQMQTVPVEQKVLKYWKTLKTLALIELILSILIILFESISQILLHTFYLYSTGTVVVAVCVYFIGIWVGILGVIAAGLGVGAFRTKYGHKCLIISHFVMTIFVILPSPFLILGTSRCLASMPWRHVWDNSSQKWIHNLAPENEQVALRFVFAFESFMLIAIVLLFILCIVSTAFICRNWAVKSNPYAVIYLANPSSYGKGNQSAMPTGGGQVIFTSATLIDGHNEKKPLYPNPMQ